MKQAEEKIDYARLYTIETSKYPILSREETNKLFKRMNECTEEEEEEKNSIREQLILSNMGLARLVAKRFMGRGHDCEDIKAECEIGLIDSVDKYRYDNEIGACFSTFAVSNIIYNLRLYFRENNGLVRKPAYVNDLLYNYEKFESVLAVELGRTPTKKEIADKLEVPIKTIYALEVYGQPMVFLDSPVSKETEEGQTYLDYIIDDELPDEEEIVADEILLNQLRTILYNDEERKEFLDSIELSERDFEILKMRCGFYDEKVKGKKFTPTSYQKIADKLGLKSKQTIKNSEQKAIMKLRKALISPRNKRDFYIDNPKIRDRAKR